MKEIQLTKGFVSIVDDEDYDRITKHKWHISFKCPGKSFMVQSTIKGKNIYLHRFLMNPASHLVVDHIDRNPLNNQKSNLRVCTRSDNQKNKLIQPKTSIYKGVSKRGGKYGVYIRINGKHTYIGSFDNEKDAALAYDDAAIKHHGEFAYLNRTELLKTD